MFWSEQSINISDVPPVLISLNLSLWVLVLELTVWQPVCQPSTCVLLIPPLHKNTLFVLLSGFHWNLAYSMWVNAVLLWLIVEWQDILDSFSKDIRKWEKDCEDRNWHKLNPNPAEHICRKEGRFCTQTYTGAHFREGTCIIAFFHLWGTFTGTNTIYVCLAILGHQSNLTVHKCSLEGLGHYRGLYRDPARWMWYWNWKPFSKKLCDVDPLC